MEDDGWDLQITDGRPGFSRGCADGKEVVTYHPSGWFDGIRPLLLCRCFNGAFPQYFEVDQEFRLYHNLAEDKARAVLLQFDASGREVEVVRVKANEVQCHLKHLRQFQAGTGLHLAVYVDSVRYSKIALADVPAEERERVETQDRARWRRNVAACDFKDGYSTFSRALGKIILEPPAQEKAGIWPFREGNREKAVTFIIRVDEDGNEVEHTSDHKALANNFGANPGAPHYLTPVHFRREVLAKYFAEPHRYEVSDGRLRCLGLWGCQIDNDLDSHVVVFLGDLGRDLPYEERLHWRQFNVAPSGGISRTNFHRSFLGVFAHAQTADLTFRQEYAVIVRDWPRVHWMAAAPDTFARRRAFVEHSANSCHQLSTGAG
jgi:hypothetical protein